MKMIKHPFWLVAGFLAGYVLYINVAATFRGMPSLTTPFAKVAEVVERGAK